MANPDGSLPRMWKRSHLCDEDEADLVVVMAQDELLLTFIYQCTLFNLCHQLQRTQIISRSRSETVIFYSSLKQSGTFESEAALCSCLLTHTFIVPKSYHIKASLMCLFWNHYPHDAAGSVNRFGSHHLTNPVESFICRTWETMATLGVKRPKTFLYKNCMDNWIRLVATRNCGYNNVCNLLVAESGES